LPEEPKGPIRFGFFIIHMFVTLVIMIQNI